jgi:hypothetical protein
MAFLSYVQVIQVIISVCIDIDHMIQRIHVFMQESEMPNGLHAKGHSQVVCDARDPDNPLD